MKQFTSILKFCIAFLALILCMSVDAQTKLLVKNGQAAGDQLGTAVSLSSDGQVMAVGSPYNSTNGTWAGQVRVYDFYGDLIGAPINGASSDRSGSAISLNQNGTRVAIGYSFNNTNGTASGQVKIFDWNGTSWVQAGNTLNGSQEGDYFGNAISLSANGMRLAIGAKGKDSNGADAGQVRIYDWNGNAWNQVGAPINGNSYTSLGYSVSLSADGTTVAIGAPLEGGSSDTGKVRLFSLNGNTWVQKGSDINGVLYQTIRFGDALSLSADGNRVAIGAPLSNSNSYAAGVVKIYDYNGSNWNQIGDNLIGQSHDLFGTSLSLSADGSRLAVGAEGWYNQSGTGSYAKLYRWQDNNWAAIDTQAIISNLPDVAFGASISLSADGNYLAVGGPETDGNGDNAGRVSVYSVNDSPPVALCKNVTVALDETATATIGVNTIDNGSTDDKNGYSVSISHNTFTIADLGSTIPVTLTITDTWGQTDSCIAQVTVVDTVFPTISCVQETTRSTDPGGLTYTVLGDEFDPSFSDNLPGASLFNFLNYTDSIEGEVFPVGEHPVVWTVVDSAGNGATCIIIISIVDTEVPMISCVQDATRDTDSGGLTYTVVGTEFDASFADNSGNATLTNDFNGTASLAGAEFPLGDTLVTWTAIDGSGNTNSCTMTLTVADTIAPTISCVQDATRDTDSGGLSYTVVGAEFDASLSDNTADTILTNDFNGTASLAGAVLPLGNTLVTWTAIDGNGNSNSCQMTVTVADTEAPAISCVQDATRSADSGGLTYTVVGTEFDSSFADNSGNATLTNDFNGSASLAGAEFPLGDTLVTWTAVDGSGNSNSCTMTLTVADTEAPAISCVQDAIRDTDSGGLTYTVVGTEFDASFSDNTADASLTNDFNGTASLAGAILPLGNTLVAWTVVDGNGNTNSCVMTVTVVANEAPVISCNASVIQNNDAGQTGAFVTLPIPAVTDDLSFFAPSIAGTVTLLNFNDEGSLIDTPFAWDGATQENQDVVMEINYQGDFNDESESMIIIGPDGTEVFSAYGFADNFYTSTINPTFVISKATWNNWVSSYGSTLNFILVSWPTVKNDRCTSRFPFGCEDDFIQLIKRGSITISNDYNDTKNAAASDFYPIGTTTVTYTAIDQFGATASCSVDVTVVDAEAPEVTCSETINMEVPSSSCTTPVIFTAPVIQDNISSYGQAERLQNVVYNFNQNSAAVTTLIPSAYDFYLDGPNVGIADGGSDMYDAGNFITTNLSEVFLTYAENTVTNSEEFGPTGSYITKKVDNMWLLAVNLDGITDFNIDGGLGADGNGVVDGYSSVIQVNGENYSIFVKRVRENPEANEDSDPSVNHLIIIPENPEASHNFSTNTDEDQHQVTGLQNTQRLYYLLYASENSGFVDNATTESIATAFINSIASPSGSVIQTAGLPSGSEFPVGTTTNTFEATDAAGNTTTCSFDVTVTVAESLTGYISEIAGSTDGDEFGISVSLSADGLRMAVGASENDFNGEGAGQTRVYQWNGCGWVQLGAALNGDATEDWSGFSVSMSADGNRVAVSSFRNDNNGEDAGLVKLFDWNGTNWIQVGNDIIGSQAGDLFGHEISLSADGNRIAIGAISTLSSGFVQLFDWNGTTWTQVGADIIGSETGLSFGWSVSLSADGNRVAIGDPWDNDNGDNSGKTKVYDWNGSEWAQLGLAITGEASDYESGCVVRLSNDGNRLAIGASLNDANGENSGQVKVYDWSGNAWMQAGANINGASEGDLFGGSVSLANNGNRLAIGASLKDDNGKNSGQVKIYDWDGNAWVQLGPGINGKAAGLHLGVSTSLSADGTRLAAGAPFGSGTGYVATVILDTPPVAVCQDITVNLDSNGTYKLSAADIDNGSFDNDGPVTLSIAPVSFDCSDLGTPIAVTLTVTDTAGQSATCTATVTVEDNEAPVITCAVNDTRSTDAGASEYTVQGTEFDATFTDNCTNATLTNDFNGTASLAGAVLPLGDTVVTWTVDDGNGNTAHCTTTLTVNASIVDETSLLSSYTIIGRKGVSLVGTKVTGGVGVKGQNKVARIWALSSVNGFVKSKHIWKGWWSSVDSLIYERTTVNLPNFHENTADRTCGINITVAPFQTLTLTDQIYNNVTVRQGGTLIIASPEVYIKKLSTATNTTIRFNQSSAVMIDKTMQLGGNTSISEKTHTVTFYVEKDVTVGPGSQVNANIYTKQNLRLQPSSYRNKTRMTGQFIALNEVFASANSVWTSLGGTLDTAPTPNGPDNCGSEQKMVMNQNTETSYDTDIEITITKDAIVLYPVPTRDILNIKLTSPQDMPVNYSIVTGNGNVPISQKWDLTKGENTTKVDVSRLSDGQYYILFSVAGEQISKSFIILSGR